MRTRTSIRTTSASRANSNGRRAVVVIAVLVCLSIVLALLGTMLRGALRANKQLHRERDLRQTEFLMQAGSDRALYRLANDASYRGETWNLPADAIVDKGEGRVTIEISPVNGQTAQTAKVMAEYPLGGETSIRRSRTFQIPSQKPHE